MKSSPDTSSAQLLGETKLISFSSEEAFVMAVQSGAPLDELKKSLKDIDPSKLCLSHVHVRDEKIREWLEPFCKWETVKDQKNSSAADAETMAGIASRFHEAKTYTKAKIWYRCAILADSLNKTKMKTCSQWGLGSVFLSENDFLEGIKCYEEGYRCYQERLEKELPVHDEQHLLSIIKENIKNVADQEIIKQEKKEEKKEEKLSDIEINRIKAIYKANLLMATIIYFGNARYETEYLHCFKAYQIYLKYESYLPREDKAFFQGFSYRHADYIQDITLLRLVVSSIPNDGDIKIKTIELLKQAAEKKSELAIQYIKSRRIQTDYGISFFSEQEDKTLIIQAFEKKDYKESAKLFENMAKKYGHHRDPLDLVSWLHFHRAEVLRLSKEKGPLELMKAYRHAKKDWNYWGSMSAMQMLILADLAAQIKEESELTQFIDQLIKSIHNILPLAIIACFLGEELWKNSRLFGKCTDYFKESFSWVGALHCFGRTAALSILAQLEKEIPDGHSSKPLLQAVFFEAISFYGHYEEVMPYLDQTLALQDRFNSEDKKMLSRYYLTRAKRHHGIALALKDYKQAYILHASVVALIGQAECEMALNDSVSALHSYEKAGKEAKYDIPQLDRINTALEKHKEKFTDEKNPDIISRRRQLQRNLIQYRIEEVEKKCGDDAKIILEQYQKAAHFFIKYYEEKNQTEEEKNQAACDFESIFQKINLFYLIHFTVAWNKRNDIPQYGFIRNKFIELAEQIKICFSWELSNNLYFRIFGAEGEEKEKRNSIATIRGAVIREDAIFNTRSPFFFFCIAKLMEESNEKRIRPIISLYLFFECLLEKGEYANDSLSFKLNEKDKKGLTSHASNFMNQCIVKKKHTAFANWALQGSEKCDNDEQKKNIDTHKKYLMEALEIKDVNGKFWTSGYRSMPFDRLTTLPARCLTRPAAAKKTETTTVLTAAAAAAMASPTPPPPRPRDLGEEGIEMRKLGVPSNRPHS